MLKAQLGFSTFVPKSLFLFILILALFYMRLFRIILAIVCLIQLEAVAQPTTTSGRARKEETLNFSDTSRRQERRFELGIKAGATRYVGDLSADGLGKFKDISAGGGVFIRKHLWPFLALRADVFAGDISAQDRAYPERAFSHKGSVTEASLQAEWHILGHRRFRAKDTVHYHLDRYTQIAEINQFKRRINPYLFAGIGLLSSKSSATFNQPYVNNNGYTERVAQDIKLGSGRQNNRGVKFGGGLSLDISQNWSIGGELSTHTSFDDYLDGISVSGSDKADWFWFGGITISRRLGWRDRDGDGIADSKDKCPTIPGRGRSSGCPDADQDGIADKDDECPHRKGIANLSGCPMKDMDNDSVPDVDDLCPNVFGLILFKGCPDTDGDGVEDKKDSCLTVKGLITFNGCPDTDGDGIEDKKDACPKEKGSAEYYFGCPAKDTDGDGVEDKLDGCLLIAGKPEFKGCPDTDGDGVEDSSDACPKTAGKPENKGCPVVDKKDEDKLALALTGVKFETGKSILKSESNKILNDIADIMARYPDYNLTIAGHTDDQGKDDANQALSEKRAQACMEYLNKKGTAKERMTAAGFGETSPIADNKTTSGRTKNRRVEFKLVLANAKK